MAPCRTATAALLPGKAMGNGGAWRGRQRGCAGRPVGEGRRDGVERGREGPRRGEVEEDEQHRVEKIRLDVVGGCGA